MQSNEEVLRLFNDFEHGGFASPDLIFNEKNAGLLAEEITKMNSGFVSISNLMAADKALGSKLDRRPEPTAEDIATKLEKKMRKDYLDSIAPQSTLGQEKTNQQKADENKKIANEKEYKTLISQIEHEISHYIVGHASGVTDYARTESGRKTLRGIRDSHDRSTIVGAKQALAAIRAVKSKL